MESLACLNGELMPVDQARVPVWDRGFLFGDAVYEVIRLYGGRCWHGEEHFARLRRNLVELEISGVDLDRLADRLRRTIEAAGVQEGTAYLQITRGVAPRRHVFPDPAVPPTEVMIVAPFNDEPTARLRASGVPVLSHPDLRWGRCDIKSTNLLANVLAAQAARRAGCPEAILINERGLVTEATHSSVLWVRNHHLEATPASPDILPGITRRQIHRLVADEGLMFAEARVTLDELQHAAEVLLVGTTIEVLPVIQIDGRPVASGRPGPIAQRLQAAYRRAVERWLASPVSGSSAADAGPR